MPRGTKVPTASQPNQEGVEAVTTGAGPSCPLFEFGQDPTLAIETTLEEAEAEWKRLDGPDAKTTKRDRLQERLRTIEMLSNLKAYCKDNYDSAKSLFESISGGSTTNEYSEQYKVNETFSTILSILNLHTKPSSRGHEHTNILTSQLRMALPCDHQMSCKRCSSARVPCLTRCQRFKRKTQVFFLLPDGCDSCLSLGISCWRPTQSGMSLETLADLPFKGVSSSQ